jgi:hypothetical protein
MECWNDGVMGSENGTLQGSGFFHYSNTPVLHHSSIFSSEVRDANREWQVQRGRSASRSAV